VSCSAQLYRARWTLRPGGVDVNAEGDANMAKGKFIVFNEPRSPEADAEYNAWYSETHLPQILENCPSITAASRFKLLPGQEHAARSPQLSGDL
jgi:hypothetical protein